MSLKVVVAAVVVHVVYVAEKYIYIFFKCEILADT